MEKIELIEGDNKWCLEFRNERGKKHYIGIPPTSGSRVDFIDKNFKYHYDYGGLIGWGFKIIIRDGERTIKRIGMKELTRNYR